MLVRIRFPRGRLLRRQPGRNRDTALAFSALLTPICLMAYVLGFWSLGSDLGAVGEFGIGGLFSHWQVWMALAVALHLAQRSLARYGAGHGLEIPRVLRAFPKSARPPETPAEAPDPPQRRKQA